MEENVDNITGLQLVLLCHPWSDGKGKGQFTSQGGSAVELDLKIQVRRHCHRLHSPPLPPIPLTSSSELSYAGISLSEDSSELIFAKYTLALCTLNSNKIENGGKMENAAWRVCVAYL